MTRIIMLNGGSSAGKTSIAEALQNILPGAWLRFSIDDLIGAMPSRLLTASEGVGLAWDGQVRPGPAFRTLEAAWMQGIAAMARAGADIIIDDVFLEGAASRSRWEQVLADVGVLWVGVYCDAEVAAQRERQRPDRIPSMAERQAKLVHAGMVYDVEVNTTHASPADCAHRIASRMPAGEQPG